MDRGGSDGLVVVVEDSPGRRMGRRSTLWVGWWSIAKHARTAATVGDLGRVMGHPQAGVGMRRRTEKAEEGAHVLKMRGGGCLHGHSAKWRRAPPWSAWTYVPLYLSGLSVSTAHIQAFVSSGGFCYYLHDSTC